MKCRHDQNIDDLLASVSPKTVEIWQNDHPKNRTMHDMNENYKRLREADLRYEHYYNLSHVGVLCIVALTTIVPLIFKSSMTYRMLSPAERLFSICLPFFGLAILLFAPRAIKGTILVAWSKIRFQEHLIESRLIDFRTMVERIYRS